MAAEKPAGEETDKREVVEADGEQAGQGNVEIRAGPVSGPLTGDADGFHEKPAGVVEKNGGVRKPRAEQEAGEIADEHERAEWNGEDIGRAAGRRENVEIPRDERNGTEPRGERSEKEGDEIDD